MTLRKFTVCEQVLLLMLNNVSEIRDVRGQNKNMLKGSWLSLYNTIGRLEEKGLITVHKRFDFTDIKITDDGRVEVDDGLNVFRVMRHGIRG